MMYVEISVALALVACLRGAVCRLGPMHLRTHRIEPQVGYLLMGLACLGQLLMLWADPEPGIVAAAAVSACGFGLHLAATLPHWTPERYRK